jgi:hypothetical protein
MRQHWTDPAAIEAEIARIRSLPLDALRRRWRVMFGRTPPAALSKDLLGRNAIVSFMQTLDGRVYVGQPAVSWVMTGGAVGALDSRGEQSRAKRTGHRRNGLELRGSSRRRKAMRGATARGAASRAEEKIRLTCEHVNAHVNALTR